MGESFLKEVTWYWDILRFILSILDRGVYLILYLSYQLFFNVANAEVISGQVISGLFGRVQLIIGVFMMFQLAMSIVKGIMDPDSFVSGKTGFGNIIMRIMLSLFMLTLLVPINIPSPRNEYERKINNNGLLFGTLYSLQNRLLTNNTLGRLILGVDGTGPNYTSNSGDDIDNIKYSARVFTSTILKGFYKINLLPEEDRVCEDGTSAEDGCPDDDLEAEMINDNRVCDDIDDEVIEAYTREDAHPEQIISLLDVTCDTADLGDRIQRAVISFFTFGLADGSNEGEYYAFTFIPVLPTIAGIVFVFILLSFTIDAAVRAIKLAVLRLIAPIPIISYMDPKGGKDGAFSAWVKMLTTTYLELFINLAAVLFVLFIIESMMTNGIQIGHGTGFLGFFSKLAIWIGLFVFARQAKKFILDALGLKDKGGHLFGGLGEAMGLANLAAGTVGSFNASRTSSRNADIERYKSQGRTQAEAEAMANRLGNRGRQLVSGLFGAGAGATAGWNAYTGAKDHQGRAVFDAMSQRNARVMEAGRNGGTFFGAVGSDIGQMFTGESEYGRLEAGWKAEEQRIKNDQTALKSRQDALKAEQNNNAHRKNIMDRSKSKAIDSDKTTGTYRLNGQDYTGNYRAFHSAYEAAVNHGTGVHTQYVDAAGNTITKKDYEGLSATDQALYTEKSWFDFEGQKIDMAQANSIDLGLKDANTANFYEKVVQFEQDVAANIANGMTETDARNAAKTAGGIEDLSILADREAYREGKIAQHIADGLTREQAEAQNDINLERTYDGVGGLKMEYGVNANRNTAAADVIARESQELSRRSQAVNDQRQSAEAQRAQSNAGRFRRK